MKNAKFQIYQTERDFLYNSIKNNRVPQAIIFSGSDNSALMEIALDFVKALHNGEIKRADFVSIEPENGQISIGKIRELQSALNYRPQFAKIKVVIVNFAHTLNKLAQNCFLKTLEEPKGETIFILITKFPELLLPTIRSRSAILKFYCRALPAVKQAKEIAGFLRGDLIDRFAFLERLVKESDREEIVDFLEGLIIYLRKNLLENPLSVRTKQLAGSLNQAEKTRVLVSSSNVNQRLALENLILNL